tara:strand:+ start:4051 stop:4503 length:453 start_codon:yes stop_codon:yes gene_type:complete
VLKVFKRKKSSKRKSKSTRKTLSHGIGWLKFLLVPVFLVLLANIILYPKNATISFILIIFTAVLFYLIGRYRRMEFDYENLYIMYGTDERVINFSSIVSVKRSNSKKKNKYYWKVTYFDKFSYKNSFRYKSMINSEFQRRVKKVNSEVRI